MGAIPDKLRAALRPVTVVVGHYGAGKTNFTVNLAIDLRKAGFEVSVVDLDIVNPYFRASEQRALLEEAGVKLVAPVFAEFGTSLDVPSLTGQIEPSIRDAGQDSFTLIDAGGDDVGATALGRYARVIAAHDYAMLYVANRFRNLVAHPADALENLQEIEVASRLRVTGIVNNSHLKGDTTEETLRLGANYAHALSELSGLPVVCTTHPAKTGVDGRENPYPVHSWVHNPWEITE